jgi:L-asparaginase
MVSKSDRAKVCVLLMGGSSFEGMRKLGFSLEASPDGSIKNLIPEANLFADVDVVFLTDEMSSALLPEVHWPLLAQAIVDRYNDYDGFVVFHGKDTILSTASGLAFMLPDLGKPVVFTGSSYHANERVLKPKFKQLTDHNLIVDTRLNVLNAILAATLDFGEVALVFDEDILRAVCAKRYRELARNVFQSFSVPPLGKVGAVPVLYPHARKRHAKPIHPILDLQWDVAVLDTFQGARDGIFRAYLSLGYKGLVVRSFGIGSLPQGAHNNWLREVSALLDDGVPIVFVSNSPDGLVDLGLYTYQSDLDHAGLIGGGTMTVDAAMAKLMWAMRGGAKLPVIKKRMEKELIGEMPTI